MAIEWDVTMIMLHTSNSSYFVVICPECTLKSISFILYGGVTSSSVLNQYVIFAETKMFAEAERFLRKRRSLKAHADGGLNVALFKANSCHLIRFTKYERFMYYIIRNVHRSTCIQ